MSLEQDNNRSIDFKDNKGKSEITIDFMMIIGKYYNNPQDFINTMKTNSKYKDLVSMYHFNPISEVDLFDNIETQHFYNKNDIKLEKDNLYKYIYWFKDKDLERNKRSNQIFKDRDLNYITSIYKLLENWSGNEYKSIIFDSYYDYENNYENEIDIDIDNEIKERLGAISKNIKSDEIKEKLNNIAKNLNNLYFIIIDNNNNIFGFFQRNKLDFMGNSSAEFIFSLRNEDKKPPKKFISNCYVPTRINPPIHSIYPGSDVIIEVGKNIPTLKLCLNEGSVSSLKRKENTFNNFNTFNTFNNTFNDPYNTFNSFNNFNNRFGKYDSRLNDTFNNPSNYKFNTSNNFNNSNNSFGNFGSSFGNSGNSFGNFNSPFSNTFSTFNDKRFLETKHEEEEEFKDFDASYLVGENSESGSIKYNTYYFVPTRIIVIEMN